jgi:hypothetical protein
VIIAEIQEHAEERRQEAVAALGTFATEDVFIQELRKILSRNPDG